MAKKSLTSEFFHDMYIVYKSKNHLLHKEKKNEGKVDGIAL